MITKRIIPCLDVRRGRVVKGVNFEGLSDVDDPVALARFYNDAGADDAAWREGVKLVQRQLLDVLHKMDLTEIDASGKFDPALHEAVMQEAVEGRESGEIIAVFQKGYRVGDRIIRHSMVKVAE